MYWQGVGWNGGWALAAARWGATRPSRPPIGMVRAIAPTRANGRAVGPKRLRTTLAIATGVWPMTNSMIGSRQEGWPKAALKRNDGKSAKGIAQTPAS